MARGRQMPFARLYNPASLTILICCFSILYFLTSVLADQASAQPQQQYPQEAQLQPQPPVYQPEAQPQQSPPPPQQQQQQQQQQRPLAYAGRDRTLQLTSDRSRYDSTELSAAELQGSAVSAFCKSFSFLCHLRCIQRGDPHDAGNIGPNTCGTNGEDNNGGRGGEINRCTFVSGGVSSVRVLCVCSNGVDLTAEVDYALEGVIDNGQNNAGAGEAGMIRQVAYSTRTKTVTTTKTLPVVTKTTTLTHVVWSSTTFTTTSTVTVVATRL